MEAASASALAYQGFCVSTPAAVDRERRTIDLKRKVRELAAELASWHPNILTGSRRREPSAEVP